MKPALTERRKADRAKIAEAVATIARDANAECEITVASPHETLIEITAARGLCLCFDLRGQGNPQPDVYVLPWCMTGSSSPKMSPAVFDFSVNPHHGQKATLVRIGVTAMLDHLADVLLAANLGRAFL